MCLPTSHVQESYRLDPNRDFESSYNFFAQQETEKKLSKMTEVRHPSSRISKWHNPIEWHPNCAKQFSHSQISSYTESLNNADLNSVDLDRTSFFKVLILSRRHIKVHWNTTYSLNWKLHSSRTCCNTHTSFWKLLKCSRLKIAGCFKCFELDIFHPWIIGCDRWELLVFMGTKEVKT